MRATKSQLSEAEIQFLKDNGWKFTPTGPNEWTWLKFNEAGKCIAQAGDDLWTQDLERCTETFRVKWAGFVAPSQPSSLDVLNDPHFVGLWTYRPAGRAREFSASVMIDGQVQETEMNATWGGALIKAKALLRSRS